LTAGRELQTGSSIRAITRITGVGKNTVAKLLAGAAGCVRSIRTERSATSSAGASRSMKARAGAVFPHSWHGAICRATSGTVRCRKSVQTINRGATPSRRRRVARPRSCQGRRPPPPRRRVARGWRSRLSASFRPLPTSRWPRSVKLIPAPPVHVAVHVMAGDMLRSLVSSAQVAQLRRTHPPP